MRATDPKRGLVLLEAMVALVILTLVVVAYFQLFHGGHEMVNRSRDWSSAIAYASDGIEQAKLDPLAVRNGLMESRADGFRRRISVAPWAPGLTVVTVTVFFPAGGQFDLYRLENAVAFKPIGATPRVGAVGGGGAAP